MNMDSLINPDVYGVPLTEPDTRQPPDIIEAMTRVLRLYAQSGETRSSDPSLNAATILHAEGFTASDIVEHLPDVIRRARIRSVGCDAVAQAVSA